MNDRPILFSAPMIKAIKAGNKTQTRRICKNSTDSSCPYGAKGDRLWVKESWRALPKFDDIKPSLIDVGSDIDYLADDKPHGGGKKRPSIFMPRWASRISLDITGIRLEPLFKITNEDAIAEGCSGGHGSIPGYMYSASPVEHYFWLWDQINGEGSYNKNPLVWVVEFAVSDRSTIPPLTGQFLTGAVDKSWSELSN